MEPIKAVAGGDSWNVRLPLHLATGGGIAHALFNEVMGIEFTNIAHAGDTSEQSMGLGMATKLESVLPGADILLWSSGGDDFAGDPLDIFLQDNMGQGVNGAVNLPRLQTALSVTMMDYERLVEIRDTVAPDCLIVCHSYDYPPPAEMGVGFLTLGPWLSPSLIHRGWTSPIEQAQIIKMFLLTFRARLAAFASMSRKFNFVDTQGVCLPEDFANELHLATSGCMKVARKINLDAVLPWLNTLPA